MLHIDPRDLARPHPSDLSNLNQDVDRDGTIDIAIQCTCGLPAGATIDDVSNFEFEISEATSAGGTYTVRETATSPTGKVAFKANSEKFYKTRARAIGWTGTKGTYSSLSAAINPSGAIGSPASPTGILVSAWRLSVNVQWTAPTELDYSHTNVRMGSAVSQYSSGGMTVTSNSCVLYYPQTVLPEYVWLQHVNTSGLASAWVRSSGSVIPDTIDEDHLAAGAAGATATANLGTSLGGSVNAGAGSSTLLILSWKCTSSTSGVTVTLGSKSQTFDFVDQAPFTMISRENGGGSFSSSKSGGGTVAGAELVAITLH